MLYIQPDECVDCDACVPVFPVTAIFSEEDTPTEWRPFVEINASTSLRMSRASGRPAARRGSALQRSTTPRSLPGRPSSGHRPSPPHD
jgi:ferredoxin